MPRTTLARTATPISPLALLAACSFVAVARATPIISEILPGNRSGHFRDEDGTASDWVEIFNPDPTPVNLAGWCLTDSQANLSKWTFPSITLAPGGFLRVWCSGKDRKTNPAHLHTNFQLSESGEYLALCSPGGANVISEFAPQYPATEPDESFGPRFNSENLMGEKSAASAFVPKDDSLGQTWTQPSFSPSGAWISGQTNLGFGLPVLGFAIQERLSSAALTTIGAAEALLNAPATADTLTGNRPVVNFYGAGATEGRFGNGLPTLRGGDQSNFALRATGTLVVPKAGEWTFAVGSDEGFRLRIDGAVVSEFVGTRLPAETLATVTLTAGNHALDLSYFENTGGDELELSAAEGAHSSFSSFFKLVGDLEAGGLPIFAPATGEAVTIRTDLSATMKNASASVYVRLPFTVGNPAAAESLTLRLAYSDGFAAYLNGVEVARRNAPPALGYSSAATAARSTLEALTPETIELRPFLSSLRTGANVLAIHGLNSSAGDDTFFLAPTLTLSGRAGGQPVFFRQPTPGEPNVTDGYFGHVADTKFTPKRGLYTAPVNVAITTGTPNAVIRYTTNGGTPSLTNGETYTGPIPVKTSTVIRAAAFREGYEPTNVDTHSYLFLDDVIVQGSETANGSKPGPDWPNPGTVAGQSINYGMDQTIVNNANPALGGPEQVKAALKALPTLCLSTDLPNLFHGSTGIYTHPDRHGSRWERPASLEMLNDPSTPEGGFEIPCGVRIRGGYSRATSNPKHSFRFFFREEYGPTILKYPIYGAAGADEFDAFDVQCSQNYSWSFEGNGDHNALREIWSRDAQLDLGHPSTRGRFVHLYINAVYWGLFQIQERAEAAFGATYLGGDKDNFDTIKHTGASGSYTTEATDGFFTTLPDGSDSAWRKLWIAARACHFINTDKDPANPRNAMVFTTQEKNAAYFKLMGLQADGRTPSGDPVLLDVDNLIDYTIITFFAKNGDAPLTGGGTNPNNFYCLRDRAGARGFISIQHDGEHSLNAGGASDRWGPFTNAVTGNWNKINFSNPQYFHQDLTPNVEYKARWADHLYRAFYNNGAMTTANNQARLDRRASEVESGIIAESARWGDSKIKPARNANNWRTARNNTRNWFTNRNSQFLTQAKQRGFFPNTLPPEFNQRGGHVKGGFEVVLTNPNGSAGTIYYTTDGSDPRPIGGGATTAVIVPEFANGAASFLVPTAANGGDALAPSQWAGVAQPPNAAQWQATQLGMGFGGGSDFAPYLKRNLQSAMQFANASLYVRVPFRLTAAQAASVNNLWARVRYNDGLVMYLNGAEVSRKNAPDALAWNSASASARATNVSANLETIDLATVKNLLLAGDNLLAFHVLNDSAASPDFLFSLQVELETTGAIAAAVYERPIPLFGSTTIKTRMLTGAEWSALNEASFFVDATPASAANLVISEFSYNPTPPRNVQEASFSASDFEFLEVQNIADTGVDLTGVKLAGALAYDFVGSPAQLTLPPGARMVIASNVAAFQLRYGAKLPRVVGPYSGNLANSGETIRFVAADGKVIKEFTYNDKAPWPTAADGEGHSLVLINPKANPDHANPANWRSSVTRDGGNPTAEKGGTYADWAKTNGVADPLSDRDGDGRAALAEYAFGSSPSVADSAAPLDAKLAAFTINETPGQYLTVSLVRALGADDVALAVETSPDLRSPWTPANIALVSQTTLNGGAARLVFRLSEPTKPGDKVFARLRIALRP